MSFRPLDGLLLACLGASFAAMAFAFRGQLAAASALFLFSYVFDALHAASSPPRAAHRFGAELSDVVALVAFSAAPSLILYAVLSASAPGLHFALAALLASVPLVTGAVRLALHTIRPRGEGALATGLPRAQSALFAVAFCFTSFFDVAVAPDTGLSSAPLVAAPVPSTARAVVLSLVPFVALLNVARWPFLRPFARPLSAPRFVLVSLAGLTTLVGFSIGYGFDVVFAWAALALVLPLFPAVRRLASVTEQRA